MDIAEPPLNCGFCQCCVLTGEVQRAERGRGNLSAYWSGQIGLMSLVCQWIHSDAFRAHEAAESCS